MRAVYGSLRVAVSCSEVPPITLLCQALLAFTRFGGHNLAYLELSP